MSPEVELLVTATVNLNLCVLGVLGYLFGLATHGWTIAGEMPQPP